MSDEIERKKKLNIRSHNMQKKEKRETHISVSACLVCASDITVDTYDSAGPKMTLLTTKLIYSLRCRLHLKIRPELVNHEKTL